MSEPLALWAKGLVDSLEKKVDELPIPYKPQAPCAFAQLPTPAKANYGNVYDVTDAFTTDSRFIEGAGIECVAHTNVCVIKQGSSYKFDLFNIPTSSGGINYHPNNISAPLSHTEVTIISDGSTPPSTGLVFVVGN